MFFINPIDTASQADLKISIVGGSNSVMRRGYTQYLDTYLSQITSLTTSLKYYSLGGVPNIFGLIQEDRYNIALNSDLIFFEDFEQGHFFDRPPQVSIYQNTVYREKNFTLN